MLNRLIKNWKTTMKGLIPAICVVVAWLGFDVDPEKLMVVATGVYSILFLFAKDA